MRYFNNLWFRWFAGAFLLGTTLVAGLRATNRIKDLKIEGRTVKFSDTSAWIVAGLLCGLFSGVLGLGAATSKKLMGKALK